MLKSVIRIAILLFTAMTGITSLLIVEHIEYHAPYNSMSSFTLYDTAESKHDNKRKFISDLEQIANDQQLLFIKTTATQNGTQHDERRNIVMLGNIDQLNTLPQSPITNLTTKTLQWTDGKQGHIITAAQFGNIPVTGRYYYRTSSAQQLTASDTAHIHAELQRVANAHHRTIEFSDNTFSRLFTSDISVMSIIGAWCATLLIIISCYSTLLIRSMRSQTIRYLAGISTQTIFKERIQHFVTTILVCTAVSTIAVALAMATYLRQPAILLHVAKYYSGLIIFGIALSSLIVAIFAYILRPKHTTLHYGIQKKWNFRYSSRAIEAVSITIIATLTPILLISSWVGLQTLQRANRSATFNTVNIIHTTADPRTDTLPHIDDFFQEAQHNNNIAFYFPVSQMLDIGDEIGNYSNVAVVNPEFLKLIHVGIDHFESNGKLGKLDTNNSHQIINALISELAFYAHNNSSEQSEANEQESEALIRSHVHFYTYQQSGQGFIVPDLAHFTSNGRTQILDNPIVAVVDLPVATFSSQSLLNALLDDGMIMFLQEDMLHRNLEQSGFVGYVHGIDRIGDMVVTFRQHILHQILSSLTAITLLCITILAIAWQQAALWVQLQRKRIFILRTAGKSIVAILGDANKISIAIATVSIVIGSILANHYYNVPIAILALSSVLLFALYECMIITIYRLEIHHTMKYSILRKE